jgi:PAS domain S-box-containing protein
MARSTQEDNWPPGAEAVFGWSADEAIGQPLDMTHTPEDRAAGEPEKEFEMARATGYAPNIRWHLRKDGTRVFIEGSARARRDAEGRFQGVLKIDQEATGRRLDEQRRRDDEERPRLALESRVAEATRELRALSHRLLSVQEAAPGGHAEGARSGSGAPIR